MSVAVPSVIVASIAVADERLRLLTFGLIVAAALVAALVEPNPRARHLRAAVIAAGAIVVLRWIPIGDVSVFREVLLLALAVAIVAALRWSPLGVAVAVVTALFTPGTPLRTLALPVGVLLLGLLLGRIGRVSAAVPASVIVAAVMICFPWSGALARAPRAFVGSADAAPRHELALSLAAGETVRIDVPDGARSIIVSGANVTHLEKGSVIGWLDPGRRELRIGTVADWGFARREHFYASSNSMPRDPAGRLRDHGYSAWIDGAARLPLPSGRTIRITAGGALPQTARLQVEAFEMRAD